jgi:hypothetical protein
LSSTTSKAAVECTTASSSLSQKATPSGIAVQKMNEGTKE